MALDLYRRKRNFEKTSEPSGGDSAPPGWSYLIQKHAARRLHYDLRLEMDGVLKSWAVTRGPSLVAGERRLAVHVEDHPLDYGSFEGTIPKGQYGGGTVLLWDRGRWTPLGDPHESYAKGHLEFELQGEKLRGRWHLVRMRGKDQEKRDNWLLIKALDAVARPANAEDILEERQESVKTGRDLAEIGVGAPAKIARSGWTKDWVKSKCSDRQEFVIGGYVVSTTSAKAIVSLVLGLFDRGELRHVGRVGTGFSSRLAADLFRRLKPMEQAKSPFAERLSSDAARGVHFVAPTEVAEIEFRGWTADRNLRHASFRGLREDKPANQVVREQADAGATPASAKTSVTLTHPDRLYWPDDGITKEGLVNYYEEVWPHIAPFVVARPLALLRCSDGVGETCFFQKHAWRGINRNVKLVADPKNPEDEPFLVIDDRNGLISLVQAGVIEIHPWGSPLAALETPDSMIFDLDPGEDVAWTAVVAAAEEIRDRLQESGLAAFVKTSGGKGLHVNVPLLPEADWDAVKDFAKGMASAMAADSPERYIAVATKAKRNGRIFIDYLRNGRGATAVAPFSTRARTGAAISMPLAWEELGGTIGPAYFTVHNAIARLAHQSDDPWRMFRKMERPLPVKP